MGRFASRKPTLTGLNLQSLLCRGALLLRPGSDVRILLLWSCGVRLRLCVVSALWRDVP